MSPNLLFYGEQSHAHQVQAFLRHVFAANQRRQAKGQQQTPACIWGLHGIGKTQLVQQIAQEQGYKFAYAAPAQFEEMGDLHGMPQVQDGVTRFAPPDWVPTEPGPGILLLDDLNRADDRILRGLMQLLQHGELVSWRLPTQWQIVCTANPEGGDYSVTPMDDAMLTRLLHITMLFDAKVWARWATDAGVDPRGISFVLTYPEAVTGRLTTARSLTAFFRQIEDIVDLKAQWHLVNTLGMATLDPATVASFMSFVADGLSKLIAPEEILADFDAVNERFKALAFDHDGVRLDRLATMCTRLYLYLTDKRYTPAPLHQANLVAFLTHDALPNDLRATLHRDLLKDGRLQVAAMMRDKRLAALILAAL